MKFLVVLCLVLAFFIQIQTSLQAPTFHNKNHALRFDENNNGVPYNSEYESNDNDDREINNQRNTKNLVLINKTDLKNLVLNENAVFETLESVLDNYLPKRRNKRNDLSDILKKTWDGIEDNFKKSLPDIVENAIKNA